MQDGGQQNRECTKLHFREDPRQDGFMSDSLVHPNRKVFHCQDISHNIKKLQNAVLSSGVNTYNTKLLTKGSKAIVWEQWLNAAKWQHIVIKDLFSQMISHLFRGIRMEMR
jgi:hypothetical protein